MIAALSLPSKITGLEAARFFRRPRWRNLYGLLSQEVHVAKAGEPATRILPFVERLWLPAYAVRFRTVARQKQAATWTSVDAWFGQFSLLDCAQDLAVRELREDALPPEIGEAAAVDTARKGLLRFILGQRGQINKPTIEDVEEVKLYYFPVFIYYHRRFGKYIDIKVLDGLTGEPAGAKMRISVLNAFVALRKKTVEQK